MGFIMGQKGLRDLRDGIGRKRMVTGRRPFWRPRLECYLAFIMLLLIIRLQSARMDGEQLLFLEFLSHIGSPAFHFPNSFSCHSLVRASQIVSASCSIYSYSSQEEKSVHSTRRLFLIAIAGLRDCG